MQRSLLLFQNSIKSEETLKNYTYYLDKFISFYKIRDYDALIGIAREKLQIMVEDYVMDLKKRVNPNSVPTYIYGIQSFFDSNDIDLRWKKIRRLFPAKIKVTGDKPYTTKQVQLMLSYTTSMRNKAVIHFLAASGVRVGAVSELRLKHLLEMPLGCKAILVYEGSVEEYTTFLTPEASEMLDQYFEQRKSDGERLDENSPIFREDYRIGIIKPKPMSRKSIINMMERVVKNAGIRRVKRGARYETQLDHGFRKRFDTVMELNGEIKESFSEKMMGHSDGVRGRYVRPTIDKLFGEYKKAIPELTISDQERMNHENIKLRQEKQDAVNFTKAVVEMNKKIAAQDEVIAKLIKNQQGADADDIDESSDSNN